jgi:hypothetical protein
MSGMKTRLFLVAVAATATLAGCGADDPTPAAAGAKGQEAANRKAMLDVAACMRKNGIDMPDPQFGAGRASQRMNKPANPDTMRAAEAACAKYRAKIKAPDMSAADKEKFKKAALVNARCMRKHGIDFPDPTFDTNGGARIKLDRSLNPEGAKFQAAQKACQDTLPGGGPSNTTAGGEK